MSWVSKKYREECIPMLMEQFKYKNIMECPKLDKIVVNTCIKEATSDKKILDKAASDLASITGQKPLLTKAKKSISNFKLREGQPIGCCTTLRRLKMYEFFNRLVNLALPRVRDFKGVSNKAFDGRGNYTLGLTEHILFPEIHYDKVEKQMGMNITFVTTANTNEEAKVLLKGLGMPFRE
ncbi:MAG: 50S ribosomal protein L5 [Deltaproteobacteria bacterium]|nr:50S ribosomal protein L5 [Deltaproteobacteria bacterium]